MSRDAVIASARLVVAALGGVAVYFSYEPHGIAVAGLVGIAFLFLALSPWPWAERSRFGTPSAAWGALIGFVHAFAVYLPLLPWVGEFVGALPWVALSIACATYSLLTGAFGTLVARHRYGFLAFPFVYVAVEFALSSFPFGGFSWVRLAWGQINGTLRNLAPWGGPALVTLAAAMVGSAAAALLLVLVASRIANEPTRSRAWVTGAAVVALLAPLGLGGIASVGVSKPEATTGTQRVAAIQGNVPRMGLDFNAQRRAVLANHVNVTKELAASGEEVDLVFWPENSSDVNPFADAEAMRLITESVEVVGVPVVVGTLTRDNVGDRNTAVVFDPATGPGDMHNKKYLQPFGEWMPMRDFFHNFSSYVDMAGDFKPGDGNGTVRMGETIVGVATCYEVAFDMAYRDAVKAGAELLTTPTNNATFGFTDMTYQQLAMSRFRALETDRAVVVAATSGVSAIVLPDGSVTKHSEIFEPARLVDEVPLRDSVTFAVRYGHLLQWLFVAAGLAVMATSVFSARRGYAARVPSRADDFPAPQDD